MLAEESGTIPIEKAAILEVTVQHLSGGRIETFRTTDEHPFWVEKAADGKDGTFRPADRLVEGDSPRRDFRSQGEPSDRSLPPSSCSPTRIPSPVL